MNVDSPGDRVPSRCFGFPAIPVRSVPPKGNTEAKTVIPGPHTDQASISRDFFGQIGALQLAGDHGAFHFPLFKFHSMMTCLKKVNPGGNHHHPDKTNRSINKTK